MPLPTVQLAALQLRKGLSSVCIWLAVFSGPGPALLQPAAAAGNTLDTLEIIDTEELPGTGAVVKDEHTGSSSHINHAQIQRTAAQLGELLDSQTGVQQRQSSGFGSYSTISVRAANSDQVGIYLDGVLLNSGGQPIVDLSTLELLNVSAIDIYRGSTPLQLGQASMGGAINLLSLNGNGAPQTRLRLSGGSFSQRGLQLSNRGSSGSWDWTGALGQQQSDNDYDFINDNGSALNPYDDRRERRNNAQIERSSALLKAGYRHSATRRTDTTVQLSTKHAGVPDARNTNNLSSFATDSAQLQLNQTVDEWNSWNTRHSLYWHVHNTDYDNLSPSGNLAGRSTLTDTRTVGARSYWERFTGFGTAGLSFDIRQESLQSNVKSNNLDDSSASRDQFSANAHLAWFDSSDRWLITPAIRWQRHLEEARGPDTPQSAARKRGDTDVGAQLGLSYQVTSQVSINANLGRFYRQPSFGELYVSSGIVKQNPFLKPEEGNNLDIGLNYQGNSIAVQASVFHNRRDDLIVTTFDSRNIGHRQNTGKAFINGLELSMQWDAHEHWQLNANATIQNPRNKNLHSSDRDRILPGVARRAYFARVQYKPSAYSFWYEWSAKQQRFYDTPNIRPADDAPVHDLGLDWSSSQWQVGARIHNITQARNEDFIGFAKPERSVSFSLTRSL